MRSLFLDYRPIAIVAKMVAFGDIHVERFHARSEPRDSQDGWRSLFDAP